MIIKTKIITIIALTILLTVGASTAILLQVYGQKMIASKIDDAAFVGDIIGKSVENAMKEGDTENVQKILQTIGKNKEIVTLQIVSPEGKVMKSSNPTDIGSTSLVLLQGTEDTIQFGKPFLRDDKTIHLVKAIPNREECFGCHNASEPVIGSIQVSLDVSRSYATMLSIKRIVFVFNIVIVMVVSAVLSILFSRLVMNPLKNLLTTIKDIEAGNLSATVRITNDDELGVIGSAFNKMISELDKLYRKNVGKEKEISKIRLELEHKNKVEELNSQLEFKIKEVETANKAITSLSKEIKGKNVELEKAVERLKKINEIGRILTSIIETEELMKIILKTTADIISAEKIVLHIRKEQKSPITIQYQHGIGIDTIEDFSIQFSPSYADLLNTDKPFFLTNNVEDGDGATEKKKSGISLPLRMKGQFIGVMMLENRNGNFFTEDELEILTTLSNQAMVAIENAWLYESVKTNYFATIQSFVNALEANDTFTKGHSERVRLLSLELGRHIGLDFRELETLEHAAILHDIGKIGIDSFILNKQGKLTEKEYGIVKAHPLIGQEILSPIDTLHGVRQTIIQHHERYDGKGYPNNLRGEELSLKARILTVVDTFDAMLTDRPYRKALTLYQAQQELVSNAGTQFDPYVVNSFVELLELRGEEYLSSIGYNISPAVV